MQQNYPKPIVLLHLFLNVCMFAILEKTHYLCLYKYCD